MSNKLINYTLLTLSTLLLCTCYNNSHVRTQRVLKPDEKVISAQLSLNLVAPDTPNESSDIRSSGINGSRIGLSYLGFHGGYEQGANLSYGIGNEDYSDLILGYDIRKIKLTSQGKPYRIGLYLEMNNLSNKYDFGIHSGQVIQIRPYLMTTTSELRPRYAGIHGIYSFGDISGSYLAYEYNEFGYYSTSKQDYTFGVASLGAGITLGNELRLGDFLIQSQVDFSYINQIHQVYDWQTIQSAADYFHTDDVDVSGPVISIGMALNRSPMVKQTQPLFYPTSKGPATVLFDPHTGLPVIPDTEPPEIKFDPLTGQLNSSQKSLVFDPLTGELITSALAPTKLSPYSLLTPEQHAILLVKELQIVSLNDGVETASLLDVMDTGLLIKREFSNLPMETLPYEIIQSIGFAGERKGIQKGAGNALVNCGVCLVIPIGAMMFTGSDLLILGVLAAPVVGLSSLIMTSLEREKYELRFTGSSAVPSEIENRKKIITRLISLYVESGFPKGVLPPINQPLDMKVEAP